MSALGLTISWADGLPPSSTIEVEVTHDDGWVASATYRNGYRCLANTVERLVHWEVRIGETWTCVGQGAVELSPQLIATMARAAHAGLVACGARSVS